MALLLNGFTDHTIDTGEVEIGYSIGPANGPDILLLHGVTDRRDGFFGIYDAITKHHRVITVDQRGHGYSGHTPGHYGRDDFARDIRFILNSVCDGPTVVWGHSMGGGNTIEMMSAPPENVKAVILEDPGVFGPKRALHTGSAPATSYFSTILEMLESGITESELVDRLHAEFPDRSDSYNRMRAECLLQMDIEILRNITGNRSRAGHDSEQILQEIDCPVLLMQADPSKGGILPDAYVAAIVPDKSNFTLARINGAGHNISKEHSDLNLPVVLPWLAEING